ncbi:MAG: hypothetical protein GY851_25085 [bacterium]|nr:hypothetical protein [bacterium]
MRTYRCMLLALVFAGAAIAAPVDFVTGLVPSEQGFDGAVSVIEESVDDDVGVVTVSVPYRDMRGEVRTGQARLMIRRREAEDGARIPAFCNVHYEASVDGARKWCKRGWVFITPHYDAKAGCPLDVAIGDSNNLARAIIQWVRRLPFVDRTHLHIAGGSQGGYMALAMGAEFFPVCSIVPDAPVVNWAYNLNYFEANRKVARIGEVPPQESPLPVVSMVSELASERMGSSPVPGCYGVLGSELGSDAWYRVSPISYLDRIAAPVLMQIATGDMLVPHEQMTDRYPQDFSTVTFPEGYARDFRELAPSDAARKAFDEVVDDSNIHWTLIERPEGLWEFSLDAILGKEKPPKDGPANIDRPWSKKKQWNISVYNEGPPQPWSSHVRYNWPSSPDSFTAHYQEVTSSPDILNEGMLDRLMQRYQGKLKDVPALPDGAPANRLNFPGLEEEDVLTGLLDYAGLGRKHAHRLWKLYADGTQKPFGDTLDTAELEAALAQCLRERDEKDD